MFKKVLILMILGLVSMGVAVAADNAASSFEVPGSFEDIGDGVFVLYDSSKNPEQILSIVSFTEHDGEDYLTNDSENNYTVYAYENGTYNFVDKSMNEKGSFEIIEFEKEKYIVDFTKGGIGNESDFNDTYKFLLEFNKLNENKNITIINETD